MNKDKLLLFERMHTIGGMPINENTGTWKNNINYIRKEFESTFKTVTNTYYHGTPDHNVIKIIYDGPNLYYHRELGIDSFSVSTNDNMIKHFGRGNGFIFPEVTINIVHIPLMYYYLMASDTGISEELDDPESEMYKKAYSLGFMNRFNELGIENQKEFMRMVIENNPVLQNVDGIDIFGEELGGNSEDETALFESGLFKMFNSDYYVDYNGNQYTKSEFIQYMKQNPDEVEEALNKEGDY